MTALEAEKPRFRAYPDFPPIFGEFFFMIFFSPKIEKSKSSKKEVVTKRDSELLNGCFSRCPFGFRKEGSSRSANLKAALARVPVNQRDNFAFTRMWQHFVRTAADKARTRLLLCKTWFPDAKQF